MPARIPQLETAIILAELGFEDDVVSAGLLHDTLDDTQLTEAQLRQLFDGNVVALVLGVSKMSNVSQLNRDTGAGAAASIITAAHHIRGVSDRFMCRSDSFFPDPDP